MRLWAKNEVDLHINWCLDNGELSEYLEGILQQVKSDFQLLIVDSYWVILSTGPFDITVKAKT